jgi:hypothetical protein
LGSEFLIYIQVTNVENLNTTFMFVLKANQLLNVLLLQKGKSCIYKINEYRYFRSQTIFTCIVSSNYRVVKDYSLASIRSFSYLELSDLSTLLKTLPIGFFGIIN